MGKRWLYRLSIALATFAIGLGLTLIWHVPRPISLCELDTNPSVYGGKTIRFRAMVERSQDHITAFDACDHNEIPALAIELDPGEVAKSPLPEISVSMDKAKRIHLMDAVIAGQLDPHFGTGCWGPKYRISNARVEMVFSVQEFEGYQQAIEWLESNPY